MVIGDENANVSIDVDGETIANIDSFKYLGATDNHGQLLGRHQSKNKKGQESYHGTGYNLER